MENLTIPPYHDTNDLGKIESLDVTTNADMTSNLTITTDNGSVIQAKNCTMIEVAPKSESST